MTWLDFQKSGPPSTGAHTPAQPVCGEEPLATVVRGLGWAPGITARRRQRTTLGSSPLSSSAQGRAADDNLGQLDANFVHLVASGWASLGQVTVFVAGAFVFLRPSRGSRFEGLGPRVSLRSTLGYSSDAALRLGWCWGAGAKRRHECRRGKLRACATSEPSRLG